MNKKPGIQNGLTLIEVLVVTAIIGIVGVGIVALQFVLGENQKLLFNSFLAVDEANNNVATITRELRIARNGDNGAYALSVVDDQQIGFYSDIDFDGQVEKVRYYLSGSILYKGVIEPEGQPVQYPQAQEKVFKVADKLVNTSGPLFYYYNGDWPNDTVNNPLSSSERLSETRVIRVTITTNTLQNSPESAYTLDSFVHLRLLKDNY